MSIDVRLFDFIYPTGWYRVDELELVKQRKPLSGVQEYCLTVFTSQRARVC